MTTAATPIDIMHEVWEFSKSNDRQFESFATVLENFEEAQKAQVDQLKASAELAQTELSGARKVIAEERVARAQAEQERDSSRIALQRTQYERDTKQAELDQLQQHYRVTRDELQRVKMELDETKARLAAAQESRLTAESDSTQLKDDVRQLRGVVADQETLLRNLQSANDNVHRKLRKGFAIGVSVLVFIVLGGGIATWMSWAALAR